MFEEIAPDLSQLPEEGKDEDGDGLKPFCSFVSTRCPEIRGMRMLRLRNVYFATQKTVSFAQVYGVEKLEELKGPFLLGEAGVRASKLLSQQC